MNYFAHARRFLDDPWFVAGTAAPDWLNVVDRRIRARSKAAWPFTADANPALAGVARGIVRHHHDDRWFHQTRAFAELSLELTLAIRQVLEPDEGFRPSFLGHILVELLLDAALIERDPQRLTAYYRVLDELDPMAVATCVSTITGRDVSRLASFIPRFSAERFLYDYLDDGKLLTRINHVMRRVQLPVVPPQLADLFPAARQAIGERVGELLAGEVTVVNDQLTGGA